MGPNSVHTYGNCLTKIINRSVRVPQELFAKFQTSFYSDPIDTVFKALGVD